MAKIPCLGILKKFSMEFDENTKDKAPIAQSGPTKTKPGSINITQPPQDQVTPSLALTPRIDISRASSSSFHEDSSPENVFDQVNRKLFEQILLPDFFIFFSTKFCSFYMKNINILQESTLVLFFLYLFIHASGTC